MQTSLGFGLGGLGLLPVLLLTAFIVLLIWLMTKGGKPFLKVILVVLLVFLFLSIPFGLRFLGVSRGTSHHGPVLWGSHLPRATVMIFPVLFILGFFFLYIWLLFYIYRDARKRGLTKMEAWFWILLILFFANFVGIIIYFIVRPDKRCPYCNGIIRNGYAVCPYCQRQLVGNPPEFHKQEVTPSKLCPTCQRKAEPDFLVCPYCGLKLN